MKTKSFKIPELTITSSTPVEVTETIEFILITNIPDQKGFIKISKYSVFKNICIDLSGRVYISATTAVIYAVDISSLTAETDGVFEAIHCTEARIKCTNSYLTHCTGHVENKLGEAVLSGDSYMDVVNLKKLRLVGSAHADATNVEEVILEDKSSAYLAGCKKIIAKNYSVIKKAFDCDEILLKGCSTIYTYRIEGTNKLIATDLSRVFIRPTTNIQITACKFATICLSCVEIIPIIKKNFFGTIHYAINKTKAPMLVYKQLANNFIAELELPKGATYQHELFGKCRTKKALVKRIYKDGSEYTKGFSIHDPKFIYQVGEIIESKYDTYIEECSNGIHFFLTEQEAIDYDN